MATEQQHSRAKYFFKKGGKNDSINLMFNGVCACIQNIGAHEKHTFVVCTFRMPPAHL